MPCKECRKAHALHQREHYQNNKDYYRERERKKAERETEGARRCSDRCRECALPKVSDLALRRKRPKNDRVLGLTPSERMPRGQRDTR